MTELSPVILTQIVENIETQRRELEQAIAKPTDFYSLEVLGMSYAQGTLPEKQRKAIVAEIDTAPEDFLVSFMEEMKAQLCEEGGVLFKRWKKYQDLDAKSLAEEVAERLDKFGFEDQKIVTLTEAISVCILWLGVKVFCDRYSGKP